jgi:hypothetical protein
MTFLEKFNKFLNVYNANVKLPGLITKRLTFFLSKKKKNIYQIWI